MIPRWLRSVDWAMFVSVLSCIASWCFTFTYVVVSGEHLEAKVFAKLYSEYSDPEMLSAIDDVEEFRTDVGEDAYAYEFFRLKRNNQELGKRLDHARRRLVRFYTKVMFMYQKGDISWENYGSVMPGSDSARLFIDLFEPIMMIKRRGTNREFSTVFAWYREMYSFPQSTFQVDEKRLTEPLPPYPIDSAIKEFAL
eukprot:gnl/TRDRNA2_/TRDRNA2_189594_c0_seq1.p1 gnl/TRDRNA2_/TRDRNA2_189594_c0~~gnl/TRDRNA2_/TRDRNA2_189594_c0_seq1.p1  ORF type:complete len:196 (-),score=21.76 gnl/TRDRNA2_/TRDRNA2_189594_c0_seq1:79-666(-)